MFHQSELPSPRPAASAAALLETVPALEPVLRAHATAAERDRRLPVAVVNAMKDHGLYRTWRPRAFGGYEADPMTAFQLFEEVSRVDSAAGWNLQLSCGVDAFGPWFSDQGAQEIFGVTDAIFAGAFFPPRRAVPVDGGYRVTGRTPFVSGVDHCAWVIGLAHIFENDTPRLWDNGEAVTLITACPIANARIAENWRTLGMRGTGSHDVVMSDVFVPERHTTLLVPLDKPGSAYQGPLYRLTIWAAVAALSTVATGIARAAIDDLIELAGTKSPAYTTKRLSDRSVVQAQIGRAQGLLGAARAFLYESLREAWTDAESGRTIDMPHKTRIQLAATHAVTAATQAVDLVQAAVGTTGIREEYLAQEIAPLIGNCTARSCERDTVSRTRLRPWGRSLRVSLSRRFGERAFRRGTPPEPIAVFSAKHADVGDVRVWDEGDEATLEIGTITHSHFNPHDPQLNSTEIAARVTDEVVEFLDDLFADRVLLWKAADGRSAGWVDVSEANDADALPSDSMAYLWSGPVTNPITRGAG